MPDGVTRRLPRAGALAGTGFAPSAPGSPAVRTPPGSRTVLSFPAADDYGHPRVSPKLHPHNILVDKHSFLVGMLMRFPIDLAIVVGHPAMIGKGPIGGKAVETGPVIAGRDPVAVDSVGAYLLGFETLGVQDLHQAQPLGLGVPHADPQKETVARWDEQRTPGPAG